LELAAQYNGQPLTYNKLAKQLGVDNRTLKTHYEILEDTMLIHTIPAWTQSVKRRLISSSKHYFFDNGVLNGLRSELKTEIKESSLRFGVLFENLIINEVVKVNQRLGEEFKIFHYRTDKGQEVDLILQKNSFSKPVAVEIKSSKRPSLDDLKGILLFKEEFPEAQLYCVCRADRAYTLEGIKFIPYLEFLQKLEAAEIV
jgi:predicted AAA+ superfamily ATPase